MAEYESLSGLFTDIADAIRDKTGSEELIQAEAFPEAIAGLDVKTGPDTSAAEIITRTITKYIDTGEYISYCASSCFIDCDQLSVVFMPVAKSVGTWCFYSCTALETAAFGAVEEIDAYAFRGCTKLSALYLYGSSVPTLMTHAFSSTPFSSSSYLNQYGSIYVPDSLVEEYKVANRWSDYARRICSLEDAPINN